MSLSTKKGVNMSKINVCDLTTSNESYLVDLEDSSTLESISGGLLPYRNGTDSTASTAQAMTEAMNKVWSKP
jgi:pantothenate kinase